MSELLHESELSFKRGPQNLKDTFRRSLTVVSNVVTMTHPSKRVGTSWTISHTEHNNSQSISSRNDFISS